MNLKEKLEQLKTNLHKKSFLSSDSKEKGKKNTRPIDILIGFIESNEIVRNELKLTGLDWPEPAVPAEIDAISEEIATSVAETTVEGEWCVNCPNCSDFVAFQKTEPVFCPYCQNPNAKITKEPNSPIMNSEVMFKVNEKFYKRNIYTGAVWEWNKFHNVWAWLYLGLLEKLSSEIQAESYKAIAAADLKNPAQSNDDLVRLGQEKIAQTADADSEIPTIAHNKKDYVLFFVEMNSGCGTVKQWYRIHKEWHSVWKHTIKTVNNKKEDDWDWLGYPSAAFNYVASTEPLGKVISDTAAEALKNYKQKNPDDKKILLIGEKKSYVAPTYSNYQYNSSYTTTYSVPLDKEAEIDIETSIVVDETVQNENNDDDIGKIQGSFTKKPELGSSFGTSTSQWSQNSFAKKSSDDWWEQHKQNHGKENGSWDKKLENKSDSSNTFPSSKGTTTPESSVKTGLPNSGNNDNLAVPLYGGYERKVSSSPLSGYGDIVSPGDWVIISLEQDNKKPIVQYEGKPVKIISYETQSSFKPSTSCFMDLMHEDGTKTKTLYQGVNWIKTFKKVSGPTKAVPGLLGEILPESLLIIDEHFNNGDFPPI